MDTAPRDGRDIPIANFVNDLRPGPSDFIPPAPRLSAAEIGADVPVLALCNSGVASTLLENARGFASWDYEGLHGFLLIILLV